ncbi:HAD family phosphatase [candidate division KSB1 bacterium]|nr:HAD family phosphatase [candidate division KSB1 bacterium]
MQKKDDQITVIFFDVGDVMAHDYVDSKVADLAAKHNRDLHEMLKLRKQVRARADAGEISDREFWVQLLAAVGVTATESDLECETFEQPIEATLEVVKQLKQLGYRLVILSNDSRESSNYRRAKYGYDSIFDHVIISCYYGLIKPDSELYEKALQELNIAAHESLFIDDREKNVKASESVGMKGILFKNAAQLSDELRKLGLI